MTDERRTPRKPRELPPKALAQFRERLRQRVADRHGDEAADYI